MCVSAQALSNARSGSHMTVYLSIPYRFAEADTLVQCAHCPDGAAAAGGYLPSHKAVVLCQQWVAKEPGEVENTIVHEMVSDAHRTLSNIAICVCVHARKMGHQAQP